MSSTFCLSSLLRNGRRGLPSLTGQQSHLQRQQLRYKHQVRIILTQDLPEGQMRGMYAGEVHDVAAGYARNYLIPKKMAVYATAVNFERCGLVDPEIAEKEEEAAQKLLGDDVDEDLRAADVLKKYLRNKSVRIIRNVDLNLPNMCHPGHVNAQNLRNKLSKQLNIDLEEGETIHIRNVPILGLDDKHETELMQLVKAMDGEDVPVKAEDSDGDDATEDEVETKEPAADITAASELDGKDCDTKLKQLGDYVAKITLTGGYIVPLKFKVERR